MYRDFRAWKVSALSTSNTRKGWMLLPLALTCASLFFRPNVAHAGDADNCEHIDASEFWSPDAHWVARLYGYICNLGIMSSAAVKVDLVSAALPDSPVTILSVDMPSDKRHWPEPKWESPQALVIQLPSSANIALQMARFQNIEVQLRFCPSDPAIRDRWLAYRATYHQWVVDMAAWSRLRNQDPSKAGPEPVVPKPPEGREPDASCLH